MLSPVALTTIGLIATNEFYRAMTFDFDNSIHKKRCIKSLVYGTSITIITELLYQYGDSFPKQSAYGKFIKLISGLYIVLLVSFVISYVIGMAGFHVIRLNFIETITDDKYYNDNRDRYVSSDSIKKIKSFVETH